MIARTILLSSVLACRMLAAQLPTLVQAGGIKFDVLRVGTTVPPTVILEAGLGNPLDSWAKVWPGLSAFAKVVLYSRAGLGRSTPDSSPTSAQRSVEHLHELLAVLHEPPPYILVGKSYGGILVRLYTSLYPGEVAGLVIVDGSHEQQVQRWGRLDPKYPSAFAAYFDTLLPQKSGAEAEELRESIRIQAAGAVAGLRPVPDIPIAVLTSMQVPAKPAYVNQTAQGHVLWRAMHEEWLRGSHNALHLVTDQSGHAMEDDVPDLIVQAVHFVVDRVHGHT